MAYAAAVSLSQTIDLLLNLHRHRFDLKFQNRILSLQKHAIFLSSFLEDSPRVANNWEETIREAAEMAEGLIELILSDLLLGRPVGSSSRSSFREGRGYQLPYGFVELERAIHQIESIATRIEGGDAGAMGGLDNEVMEIVSQLRGGTSRRQTIAIFGREGMGKTVLAKIVYNHPLIVEHFEVRAWCDVSTDYGLSQVASVLRSIHPRRRERRDSEDKLNLDEDLCSRLYGKRYLIVLDDVRTVMDFIKLERVLSSGEGNGCQVLITTRVYKFAKLVEFFHEKRFMDMHSSWDMLRRKIFGRSDHCPLELESLGKKIAIGCRGHPLSIEVVSGILALDRTIAAWRDVLENIEIASADVGREFKQLLSLSYAYLPRHLRPCFLYLGIFPKDEDIRVSKLVKLWVSEGFLDEIEGKSFEETAEEHVKDLVHRNLVSVSKKKSNGTIKSITVNDAMRDLCLRQAHIDNFLHRFRGGDAEIMKLQWCRRVSSSTCDNAFLKGVYGPTIRTMILSLDDSRLGLTRWSIGNVRLLRILDLSNAYSYDLPEEVFELFHLRYLAFDCMFSISEALSNLVNLQTLIVCPRESDRKVGYKLPEGIWRMPQLRHLVIFCLELPIPTSALENLQTLSGVEDFICSIENLKMMPNLKKLALVYTKKSRDVVEDYELHNLTYLQKLEVLKIYNKSLSFREEHKMTSCVFPPTLKKLNLCGVQLPWEDMETVASLPNLQVLKLRMFACTGETWRTSEGGFSRLTFLLIDESDLKNWITETSHIPKLEHLVLRRCLSLLEVPSDVGKLLESMELDEQNPALLRSAERIQEEASWSWRYDRLRIRVV